MRACLLHDEAGRLTQRLHMSQEIHQFLVFRRDVYIRRRDTVFLVQQHSSRKRKRVQLDRKGALTFAIMRASTCVQNVLLMQFIKVVDCPVLGYRS